jgi:tRNA threonylcarbamoyladenosine biosynthesis protein TsaB
VRILAFDTATRATAVALADGATVYTRRDDPPPGQRPRHATRLLPLIDQVMAQAGVGWEEIDRIAVGLGPGTFTGLRIGVATAKALARASGIPVVGVSTLQSLALNIARSADPIDHDAVVAVLDARRGEVYAGAWGARQVEDDCLLSPRAVSPEALIAVLPTLGSSPVALGEGAIAFREVLERGGMHVPGDDSDLHRVTAAGHCLIARGMPVADPDALAPDYQRLPDAQPRPTAARRSREP